MNRLLLAFALAATGCGDELARPRTGTPASTGGVDASSIDAGAGLTLIDATSPTCSSIPTGCPEDGPILCHDRDLPPGDCGHQWCTTQFDGRATCCDTRPPDALGPCPASAPFLCIDGSIMCTQWHCEATGSAACRDTRDAGADGDASADAGGD